MGSPQEMEAKEGTKHNRVGSLVLGVFGLFRSEACGDVYDCCVSVSCRHMYAWLKKG